MKKRIKNNTEFIGNNAQFFDSTTIKKIFDSDDKMPHKSYKISDSKHTEGYIDVSNNINWIDSDHILYDTKLLTINDKKYIFQTNELFKGILYDPQATLLSAMIDLENKQSLNIVNHIDGSNDSNIPFPFTAHTRYGLLSVKFSFGKTVLALALICAQKSPLNKELLFSFPLIQPLSEFDNKNKMNVTTNKPTNISTRYNNFTPLSNCGFFPEIELCEDNVEYIPISMVAAATSIITQWENNIKTFTNLKYIIIDNVHALKKFENIVLNNKLNNYDIVLIKVGHITNNYSTIDEKKENIKFTTNRTIFSAIRSILKNKKISRFIIDDFDVIKLTGNDYLIHACFTWFISATRRQSNIKSYIPRSVFSVEEYLLNSLESPAITYTSDDVLNKTFNIRCDSNYINDHINTTNINFRKIVVKGASTKILQNLNIAPEIIEMINADAVGLAAQNLGLEVSTIGELILSITGNHIADMKSSLKFLNRINQILEIVELASIEDTSSNIIEDASIEDASPNIIEDASPNIIEDASPNSISHVVNKYDKINSIRKIICLTSENEFNDFISGKQKYIDSKNNEIDINDKNTIYKINNLKIKMHEQYEKSVIVLNRMRDNIREGYCQCCTLPFEENSAYVLGNCCQIIICEDCITTGSNTKKNIY